MTSRLDPGLIIKNVYDDATQSYKVSITGTEMSVSLDESEDTIASRGISQSLLAGDHDVSGMKTACLYGTATVSISPSTSGEDFVSLSMTALTPITICARRMRIVGTGTVVVQGV